MRSRASGRGDAGIAVVAGQESGDDPARSSDDLRTSFRARAARHGRDAPTDGQPSVFPAFAQGRLRRAGGLQHGGGLRAEVAALSGLCAGTYSSPLSEDCWRRCSAAFRFTAAGPDLHGYAMAIFLEMDGPVDLQKLSLALAGDHVSIPGAEEDSPSNVSAAGQADIQLSMKVDPAQPNGVWLWTAVDNLRIS